MSPSPALFNPDQALSCILEHTVLLPAVRESLQQCGQRILRESIRAEHDYPRGDRVCMDGIAVLWQAAARSWTAAGQQMAGDPPLSLEDAAGAIEIATGAMRPNGTNTVIRYEDLLREGASWVLKAGLQYRQGQNIQAQGSEHRSGATLLEAFMRLQAPELCLLAALGRSQVLVSAKPRIALISNGRELVGLDEVALPHQIHECNTTAARACLQAFGFDQVSVFHADDDAETLQETIVKALEKHQVLILSGGVSCGAKDLVPQVLRNLGVEEIFYQIKQRPGKPFWFGLATASRLVFGLPGNPVAALMGLRRYVIPSLAKMQGYQLEVQRLRLDTELSVAHELESMVPCKVFWDEEARIWAKLCPTRGSGDFTSLRGTQGFISLAPRREPYAAGDRVPFYAWGPA